MTLLSKRKYTRLDRDDWKVLLGLYQTGVNTVEELAARYDVSSSAIMQKARAAGVTRRSSFTTFSGLATASSGLSALTPISDPGVKAGRTKATADRITATNDAAYIGAMAIQRILEASIAAFATPSNPTEAAATIRALEQASMVQERLNKIRRTVLRLDKENQNSDVILPELPIRDMTAAEYEALRADQAREDRAHGIAALDRDLDTFVTEEMPTEPPDDLFAEGYEDDQTGGIDAMS